MNDDRAVAAVDDADFEQVACLVGTDEHRQAFLEVVDQDRMVESVDHVVVADAVLACADGDQRSIHVHKLACSSPDRKLPCDAVSCQRIRTPVSG